MGNRWILKRNKDIFYLAVLFVFWGCGPDNSGTNSRDSGTETKDAKTEDGSGNHWEDAGVFDAEETLSDALVDPCQGDSGEGLTRPCANACGEPGVETCHDGQWGECDAPPPPEEICDGLDNDCDGLTDEEDVCIEQLPRIWVFILAGQSNMVGLGRNWELDAQDSQPIDNAIIYYNSSIHPNPNALQWLPLVPGFGVTENHFGPELGMGKALRELWPNRPLAFIKVAEGGTALVDRWAVPSGDLYQLLLDEVSARLVDLSVNYRPQVVGFMWMQGESDALDLNAANAYAANLMTFLYSIRTEFSVPILPIAAGLISPDAGWTYVDTVRNATASVSLSIGQMEVVETNDLPTHQDDIAHYNTASSLTLGQRFGQIADSMLPTSWNFASDYGAAQGDGFWVYRQIVGGQSSLLSYDTETGWWTGSDPAVIIGPGFMHPGAVDQPELVWWAPYAGTVEVGLSVSAADNGGGDGTLVEAYVNGTRIWGPQEIPNNTSSQHLFQTPVTQGNELWFRTSSGTDQDFYYDNTAWQIDLEMTSVEQ